MHKKKGFDGETNVCLHLMLYLLQGLLEEGQRSGVLITEVGDNNRRSTNDLSGVSVLVNLAETSPLTELLLVGDHDEGNSLLLGQSLDELLVCWLVAALRQEDQLGVSGLESLGDLMETSDEGSTTACVLQHFLDRRSGGYFLSGDLSGHYFRLNYKNDVRSL